jgi:hypothetical protein
MKVDWDRFKAFMKSDFSRTGGAPFKHKAASFMFDSTRLVFRKRI